MAGKTQKAKAVERQMAVDWSIKPANGAEKKVPLNSYMSFLEDKGYETEKLENKIASELRKHVKKSGFKVLKVDPTLEFVDVKFKEEPPNPPKLEISGSLKSVKAEDNDDGKAQPALKFTLTAKFDLMSHGGGRKSRMTRRR